MHEMYSTVTTKGQVTIPVEIRRLLRVGPRDQVMFVVDRDEVRIARKGSVVARTAGSVKSSGGTMSAERLRLEAERAIAEEADRRSGG